MKTITAYKKYITQPYIGTGFAFRYDRNFPNNRNKVIMENTENYRNQLRQIYDEICNEATFL